MPQSVDAVKEPYLPTPCLSDRQWVAQLIMSLVEPDTIDDFVDIVSSGGAGGLVLVRDADTRTVNQIEKAQLKSLFPLLIASDEEGGRVQRLRNILPKMPSAKKLSGMSVSDVEELTFTYGKSMVDKGFNIVFAPVVDVGDGPGIGDRAYGDNTEIVVRYGRAAAKGYQRAGVLPVYKHFPGHGSASADSHEQLPTTASYIDLLKTDLKVYDQLLPDNEAGVMIGHLRVPGLTKGSPASLSPVAVNRLLRGYGGGVEDKQYAFNGLVFSDAMNMGAIAQRYSQEDASVAALAAGVDVVLAGEPADANKVNAAILTAIDGGALSWNSIDASVARVLRQKNISFVRCSA